MPGPSTPPRPSVREAVEALVATAGEPRVVEVAASLVDGAPPEEAPDIAVRLSGHGATTPDELRAMGFRGYWWPTWGARTLLYAWAPSAAPSVVRGVGHEHWRPAEMCLKVAGRRELAAAADGAVELAGHDLSRVRAVALRTLGLVGDTEHVRAVRSGLDDPDPQVRRAAGLALERMVTRLDLPVEELP